MSQRRYRKHLVFGRFNGLRVAQLFDCSESKKGDKDQESIQSSTTPDSGYHMGKRQKDDFYKNQWHFETLITNPKN